MSCELPDVLALNHVRHDDIFVASSSDKLGVVLGDVQRVDVVVVDILVVFDHDVFGRIVEAHTSVL